MYHYRDTPPYLHFEYSVAWWVHWQQIYSCMKVQLIGGQHGGDCAYDLLHVWRGALLWTWLTHIQCILVDADLIQLLALKSPDLDHTDFTLRVEQWQNLRKPHEGDVCIKKKKYKKNPPRLDRRKQKVNWNQTHISSIRWDEIYRLMLYYMQTVTYG